MQTSAQQPSRKPIWLAAIALALLVIGVIAARLFRETDAGASFIAAYPGTAPLPDAAPVGIPAWLGWQHFLNFFLIVLVIRTGYTYRTSKVGRPRAFWWSRRTREGQRPQRISVDLWFHLALDLLWLVNGVLFVVLLFVTGQWVRIVPTSWDALPNAASVLVQYLSLDWPTDNSWVAYNSLQLLLYFVTVFLAAPIAAFTGYRLSMLWPNHNERLSQAVSFDASLRVHLVVMVYFVLFIVAHVTMVFATGALRNLNHMFAGNDGDSWAGVVVFALALLAVAAAWVALRPRVIDRLAALFGNVK